GSPPQLAPAFEQLLSQRLSALYDPLVLWWTDGSAIVEPSCLIAKGLPDPETFAALLDGSWSDRQWHSIPARITAATVSGDTLVDDLMPPRFRSAAASDVGRVRAVNQDSYLERSDVGVWVVADGLGGHSDGEIASRMVCDALADLLPGAGFEQMIEAARERVTQVNEHLVRAAVRSHNDVGSGSTVVTLLARGSRCVVLWAGDSRVYRWRSGHLDRLTRDHSLAESEGDTVRGANPNAVTRAVGGEPTLRLDERRDRVRPGDRFLLCSDGLTRIVPESRIRAWLEHEDIRQAVDGLIKTTLEAGAPDNVTALIVEAYA
ncbi:MAG: protein phosphatase 2C domain-containing protein, partial [Vicinamibacterales bacterium]